jgi:hypothetical protein
MNDGTRQHTTAACYSIGLLPSMLDGGWMDGWMDGRWMELRRLVNGDGAGDGDILYQVAMRCDAVRLLRSM